MLELLQHRSSQTHTHNAVLAASDISGIGRPVNISFSETPTSSAIAHGRSYVTPVALPLYRE